MYIIEMHYKNRASAQVILEKGDASKPYDEFVKHRVITNHAGDVDDKYCRWCMMKKLSGNRTLDNAPKT